MNQQMDQVILKQKEIEKLLKTTNSSDKYIYNTQLDMWIKSYIDGMLPLQIVLDFMNNRIEELKIIQKKLDDTKKD